MKAGRYSLSASLQGGADMGILLYMVVVLLVLLMFTDKFLLSILQTKSVVDNAQIIRTQTYETVTEEQAGNENPADARTRHKLDCIYSGEELSDPTCEN
jgi:hypothetical protein